MNWDSWAISHVRVYLTKEGEFKYICMLQSLLLNLRIPALYAPVYMQSKNLEGTSEAWIQPDQWVLGMIYRAKR